MTTQSTTVIKPEDGEFQTDQVMTITGGHFVHDTYSAFVAPLLPLIIEKLSLTLTQAGSLTVFMQIPSLLNPFIGQMADRFSTRLFVILAPAATATLMSSMGLADSYFALAVILFLTGISIAAFHAPAPAMVARVSGARIGKGMSYFMAGGELARTIGPLFAVWAVSMWAFDGMYRVAILGWLSSLILYLRFRSIPVNPTESTGFRDMLRSGKRLFIPISIVLFARSFLIAGLGVYLPTLLNSEGASLWIAGGALAIYELAGVGGALTSGTISDRLGRVPVLFTVMLASSIFVFLFLQVSGWVMIPVLVLLGFVSLSSQPVLMAMVQDELPDHRAAANGFYLTLSFLLRSIATLIIGMVGDALGLRSAFLWMSIISLLCLPAILLLPRSKSPQTAQ
jgi:FSR family fosmidomycin resistance protein-like MFS transporter